MDDLARRRREQAQEVDPLRDRRDAEIESELSDLSLRVNWHKLAALRLLYWMTRMLLRLSVWAASW